MGSLPLQNQGFDVCDANSVLKEASAENSCSKAKVNGHHLGEVGVGPGPLTESGPPGFETVQPTDKMMTQLSARNSSCSQPISLHASLTPASQSASPEELQIRRQGSKAPGRVETTRPRGRKQDPDAPAVDACSGSHFSWWYCWSRFKKKRDQWNSSF